MSVSQIHPVDVVRDSDGWFSHPQYLAEPEWEYIEFIGREDFDRYCAERGIEAAMTSMESDDLDMLGQYVELGLCHCRDWQPSRPEGDGWFVLSIHDTEDGPVCVWGRRIEQEQPMSKPEVVGYASARMISRLGNGVCGISLIDEAVDNHDTPLIRLADHEADRAADKARIAELEDVIGELIAGTGTSPGAAREYGRARAALAQRGKEQTP